MLDKQYSACKTTGKRKKEKDLLEIEIIYPAESLFTGLEETLNASPVTYSLTLCNPTRLSRNTKVLLFTH